MRRHAFRSTSSRTNYLPAAAVLVVLMLTLKRHSTQHCFLFLFLLVSSCWFSFSLFSFACCFRLWLCFFVFFSCFVLLSSLVLFTLVLVFHSYRLSSTLVSLPCLVFNLSVCHLCILVNDFLLPIICFFMNAHVDKKLFWKIKDTSCHVYLQQGVASVNQKAYFRANVITNKLLACRCCSCSCLDVDSEETFHTASFSFLVSSC